MDKPYNRLYINNQGKQNVQAYFDYMHSGGKSKNPKKKTNPQLKKKKANALGHLGMKKAPKKKSKDGVQLAVHGLRDNRDLDPRLQGPQNFMDLADYEDKFEAQIDRYNEKVAITGGAPKNICRFFWVFN